MRSKRLSAGLLSVAAALSLVATTAMAAPKTVTLWHVFNLDTDMIYGGIEAFNKAQDEYRIEARVVPATSMVTELIKATATGSVPDLATLDNPVVASFSGQGTLTDLSPLVAKSEIVKPGLYFEGPWASAQWQGKTFGVPRDANTLALYYNADMFRAKGLDPDKPPRTWSELRAAAEKLRDPAKNVYGFGFSAIQAEEGVFQFLPFLTQAGGSIDKLDQPEAAAALDFLVDMMKAGIISKDVINQRQYEVANTFMAGNTAIAFGGPWELPRMEKEAKFDWRLTLLPVKDDKNIAASALGGYVFVVPKGAKQPEGAFKFIEFMSDPKILNEGWKTGRLAPRTDVKVENPRWPQAYGIYREQMQSAKARGPHPQWPDISKALQTAIQEALTGAKPSAQALQDAAKKIQPILAKTPL
ncbi:ABC transporter substrate-binding protein [Chelatococcus asaccharovorans]|uniref:ABC transporter substrate-binding protein n=1 Tax=Chelatococcus asaccharovorans TaxID=28210 RepID=UPI00224C68D6|nr:ABC transporter substrate-binding protein [Chelatococcus asaccharovorans]CAH1657892.1 Carbohydrate ABC transporter substrate-binding protein (CUT1 family) [Chelatococcus asaccharovorans]CAH1688967.1 Carbohydrate ABC transporter substrate-binding protein (CUT1 family) [Chelatococcus asaccharovorans]